MNLFRLPFLCVIVILSISITTVWSGYKKCTPEVIYKTKKVPVPVPYPVIQKVPVTVIKEIKVPVKVPIKVPYPVKVPKYIPIPAPKKHDEHGGGGGGGEYGHDEHEW